MDFVHYNEHFFAARCSPPITIRNQEKAWVAEFFCTFALQ